MGKVEVAGVGGGAVARAWIEAKVIRADGTVEDLGIVADSGLLNAPPHRGFLHSLKEHLWPSR